MRKGFSSNAVANFSRRARDIHREKKREEKRDFPTSLEIFFRVAGEDDSLLFLRLRRLLSPGSSPRSLSSFSHPAARTMSGGKRKRRRRNDRGRNRWKKPKRGDFLEEVRDSPVPSNGKLLLSHFLMSLSVIFFCRKRDRFVESPSSPSGHIHRKRTLLLLFPPFLSLSCGGNALPKRDGEEQEEIDGGEER